MLIKTTGLTLHCGGSQIPHGIGFTAKAGEVTCIMGTNGVGKTSFLKALAGTPVRSAGSIELDGETLGKLRPQEMAQRGLAVVPQGRMIFPLLTVKENLETAFALLPKPDHKIPQKSTTCSRSQRYDRAPRRRSFRRPATTTRHRPCHDHAPESPAAR